MSGGTGRVGQGELAGDAVPIVSRIVQLAEFVEVAHRTGGEAAARELAERRAGSQFDPTAVHVLCTHAGEIFGAWKRSGRGRS